MFEIDKDLDSEAPLFVLATRLYVHYRFKARRTFNPQAALIDDDYAREVLTGVRAVGDSTLLELADLFEAARFPNGMAPPAASHPARAEPLTDDPMLDFPLGSAG